MKIISSSIQLAAETSAISRNEKHETLTTWKGDQEHRTIHSNHGRRRHGRPGHKALHEAAHRNAAVDVSLSDTARGAKPVKKAADVHAIKPGPIDDLKLDILKAMIEKLTGKKINIMDPEEITAPARSTEDAPAASEQGEGFGMIYDSYESHYEYESMNFSASGSITTADGAQIDFSVDLSMTREFYSEQHIQIRAGEALKDPLSVNFSGTAAELTQTKFSFDIDADGRSEQIAFLRPGSGFLALDKNEDGRINNGTELFGALTGDGFAELARFDTDHNNFIDENDSIYDRLRIWEKDSDGRDRLMALGKAGIGAIFLGSSASPFDIRDQNNSLAGKVQSTGIFIRENGSVGTMQQLDLVV